VPVACYSIYKKCLQIHICFSGIMHKTLENSENNLRKKTQETHGYSKWFSCHSTWNLAILFTVILYGYLH